MRFRSKGFTGVMGRVHELTKNPAESTGMRYKKRKFDGLNAETDGISRLLRSKQKQKTTIPK